MEVVRERKNKRWSEAEKHEIISETYKEGANISAIARKHKMSVGQLFTWRRQFKEGHKHVLTDNVATIEVAALRDKVERLEKLLGRKSAELELLQDYNKK